MSFHGDIRLGDTIDLKFTTRAYATGAPTTLAGSPAVAAYPGNSTTEVTAGITLSVDFDSRTGLNNVRVVATSGNGYATATNYELVITAGTVGGTSVVGEVVGSFSIENRSALMPTTAGRTAVVDANGLVDANAVKLGPTGSGTAQTARDIGANVLLSAAYDAAKTASQAGDAMALTSGERNATADALLARSLGTEGYAAKGAVPTVAQAFFMLVQNMQEFSISSTTVTVKKLDGSTSAMTYTLDSATTPTSRTRA